MRNTRIRSVALLLFLSIVLLAQTNSSITGRVLAGTGQPLTAARLVAKHSDTGLTREALTDADGRFVFTSLPPGAYDLRAEMTAFRSARAGVEVNVAESVVADFSLELGTVEQAITVEGRPPGVNTQTSELSYLVGDTSMRNLPLNGRNYTDLALLQPGVIAFPHRDGGSVVAHGLGMSVNGQDPRSNQYLLDGTPLNDFTNGPAGSAASTALGMETIREFRVETNAYSAEFGRNSGGQINAISKSGTNALHGGLFFLHRNDNLDAPNYFDNPAAKPEFKRNQFGGTIGGPVRKDRAFFFAGYEALRERLGKTVNSVVPDANAHNGLFPDPANPGQLLNIGVNAAVRPYLDEFPLPNGPSYGQGLALYTFPFGQRLRQDFGQVRFDQNLPNGGQFFARYTVDDADQYLPTDMPQFPRSFLSRNQFLTAGHTYVVSSRAINNIRLGFSRTRIGQDVEANTSKPLAPFVPGRSLPGNIDIGGANRWGPQTSVNVKLTQNVFGAEDNFSLTYGRHTLKLGGLVERYRDNMVNPTFSLGIHAFADVRAFLENRPLRFVGLDPKGQFDRYWRFTLIGLYVQDDFRIHPRLTLNFGLRYETTTMPVDIYGRDSALPNLSDPAPTVGQLYQNPTRKNLSPRFGLAWDLAGDGRTSLRRYGWFFNTNNQQNLIVTVTNPPATPRLAITSGSAFPVPPFDRGVGNTMRPVEWNIKNPNTHFWNLNLQRQLPIGVVATLGYAGSRGIHLWRNTDINIPAPQVLSDGTQFWAANLPRPNRNFSTIELKRSDGNSWYNAMILELRRRWSNGVTMQSSYTFSRSIDTTQASTFFSDSTNGNVSAMPEFFGLQYNKGLSDFHVKHNWILNYTWELPFARDRKGAAKMLLDGWQVSGISSVRSGNPLTLFVQQNRSRSQWNPSVGPGIGVDRPSAAPGFTHQSAVTGDPLRYFDPRAFVLQPAGTLGNLGRGALIGPNSRSFDLSAMKNFPLQQLGESGRFQFRVEMFNLFDRANFGTPNLTAFAGQRDDEQPFTSLGLIRSTVTSARQIQLGLRISF